MSENSVRSLRQVYTEDSESCRSLIVKHYPVKWREEELQTFLSSVIRTEVNTICIPEVHCDVAVVVLPKTIVVYDTLVQRWQEKVFRKPPDDCFPVFEFLGEPSGVFIASVPASISCELLGMYFENKKSGGIEGTVVEPIEEGVISNKKFAVININDKEAIRSILSIPHHEISGHVLDISPFYPSVHRYVLETLKNTGSDDECCAIKNPDPDDIDERNSIQYDKESLVTELLDSCKQGVVDIERSDSCKQELLDIERSDSCKQGVINIERSDSCKQGVVNIERSDSCKQGVLDTERSESCMDELLFSEGSESCKPETSTNIQEVSIHSENLLKPSINDMEISTTPDLGSIAAEKRAADDEVSLPIRIVGRVQPVVRETSQHSNLDDQSLEDPHDKKTSFTEDVNLPRYKIELLNSFRFREIHESESLEIMFNKEEGTVTLKAQSFEEFKTVRNKLVSYFDDIYSKVIKSNTSKYRLLTSETNLSWLRTKFEQANVRVSLVTDDTKKEITCYSLNESDASRGITLIEESVISITIPVKEVQQTLLQSHEWLALKQRLQDEKTSVSTSQDGKSICIYSLDESQAEEAKLKIHKCISKQSIVKKAATVDLESGKARCFKENIEESLRKDVEKRNGSLLVEKISKYKIKVSCEGPDDVTDLFTKTVQGIWHESIDFQKLSTSSDDTELLMKALDGQHGKTFVSKFEQNNNCCVEVSKTGEKVIQKPRIVVKDVFSSDEESGEADNDMTPYVSEEHSHRSHGARGRDRRKHGGERFSAFKSGLSEEEELEKVLALSLKSASPVPEVSADSDSSDDTLLDEANDVSGNEEILYARVGPDFDGCRPRTAERRWKPSSGTITMSGTTVRLVKGAVAKQKADVLVNVVSSSQTPFAGVIAKSFLELGGQDLMTMYMASALTSNDNVLVTQTSGFLQCSFICHVKLRRTDDFGRIVKRAVSDVLSHCQQYGAQAQVIAFPALGVGKLFGYDPKLVAQAMLTEMRAQLSKPNIHVKDISIVILGDEIYEIFHKELQALVKESHQRGKRPFDGDSKRRKDEKQQQRQRREHDRQGQTATDYHRDARWSTSSSSNARESSHKRRPSFDSKNDDDQGRRPRQVGQTQADKYAVPDLSVRIIAENKDICIQARKEFCKKAKDKFLYEEILNKTQKLSNSSKNKIIQIISALDIKCTKGKNNYKLKGTKKNVRKAHSDIQNVLLEDKSALEQKKKLKNKIKRETMDFVKAMVEDEPEAPYYWKNYKDGETLLQSVKRFIGKKCEKVELDKSSRQFRCIVKMMTETFDPHLVGQGNDAIGLNNLRYNSLFILKIERLENFCLYEKFVIKRQELYRKLLNSKKHGRFPNLSTLPQCSGPVGTCQYVQHNLDGDMHPEINEYMLFHSTKKELVSAICNDGFDPRLGSGEAMFGAGIYGAERATKADQYADDKKNRTKGPLKMFLVRMLLGNAYICTSDNPHKYLRPPCTRCSRDKCFNQFHGNGKFGHFYDSVIGDNNKLFREFIVYEKSLCYPEYLITYERR